MYELVWSIGFKRISKGSLTEVRGKYVGDHILVKWILLSEHQSGIIHLIECEISIWLLWHKLLFIGYGHNCNTVWNEVGC